MCNIFYATERITFMKELITKKNKHLLFQDELGDDFLLLKYCEVYRRSQDTLKLVVFTSKSRGQNVAQLRKQGVILNEWQTDDGLLLLDIDKRNLPLIISMGAFERRPHKNGAWIKDKEQRLGHKIYPFNPKIERME